MIQRRIGFGSRGDTGKNGYDGFIRLAALLFLLPSVPILAAGPGTPGATGLKIPSGARPAAMGGAFTGVADDLNALVWNPAGLGRMTTAEATALHARYLVDTGFTMAAYAQPIPGLGTLALGADVLDYGSLERRGERADGLPGLPDGTTSARDGFITAGWGMPFLAAFGLDRIDVGVNAKFTAQALSDRSYYGVGIAAGALADLAIPGVRVGTIVDNLGTVAGHGAGTGMAMAWTAGASWTGRIAKDFSVVGALDTRLSADSENAFAAGAEVTGFGILALRAGWRGGGALGGPTAGVGIRSPERWSWARRTWSLDWAWMSSGDLGASQRLQLTARLGGVRRIITAGSVRITSMAGDPTLTWEGDGYAYVVSARQADGTVWSQLNDTAVMEPQLSLAGLPSGRYVFRIIAVDPRDASFRDDAPTEIEIELNAEEQPADH